MPSPEDSAPPAPSSSKSFRISAASCVKPKTPKSEGLCVSRTVRRSPQTPLDWNPINKGEQYYKSLNAFLSTLVSLIDLLRKAAVCHAAILPMSRSPCLLPSRHKIGALRRSTRNARGLPCVSATKCEPTQILFDGPVWWISYADARWSVSNLSKTFTIQQLRWRFLLKSSYIGVLWTSLKG